MKIAVRLAPFRQWCGLSGFLCLVLALGLLSPWCLAAQTVDEVIAKNIQAHGGLEKLKALQTLRISGKFSQGTFQANFLQENKRPADVREEAIIQGLAQIQ